MVTKVFTTSRDHSSLSLESSSPCVTMWFPTSSNSIKENRLPCQHFWTHLSPPSTQGDTSHDHSSFGDWFDFYRPFMQNLTPISLPRGPNPRWPLAAILKKIFETKAPFSVWIPIPASVWWYDIILTQKSKKAATWSSPDWCNRTY